MNIEFDSIVLLSFTFFSIWFSLMSFRWIWQGFKSIGNASIAD